MFRNIQTTINQVQLELGINFRWKWNLDILPARLTPAFPVCFRVLPDDPPTRAGQPLLRHRRDIYSMCTSAISSLSLTSHYVDLS
ncbi:hypothetical protein J6590_027462, partial [Homalodisca vitripennis]